MRKGLPVVAAALAVAGFAALPSGAATTTKTVAVKDDFFKPKKLTIAKGTKVKWVWKGKRAHNVTVADGPAMFRAGKRKKGTFTHTFTKKGKYLIFCTIHAPDMQMKITVK